MIYSGSILLIRIHTEIAKVIKIETHIDNT